MTFVLFKLQLLTRQPIANNRFDRSFRFFLDFNSMGVDFYITAPEL